MNVHEFALLAAVILPVATVVVMNVALALAGEKTTLLLPGRMSFERIRLESTTPSERAVKTTSIDPANDSTERIAA